LPHGRRAIVDALRATILQHLDPGIEEGMQYGMIGYYVPHSRYPAGYHCDPQQPLPFAGIASQKNYVAVHLSRVSMDPDGLDKVVEEWNAAGKRLDMGAACVRIKKLEDAALDAIGNAVGRMGLERFLAVYEASKPVPKKKR
jgi:hypothetical protein